MFDYIIRLWMFHCCTDALHCCLLVPFKTELCCVMWCSESLSQPAIHRMKGIRIVGNVVEGARPKHRMYITPIPAVKATLLWSRMMVFRQSQNCKRKYIKHILSLNITDLVQIKFNCFFPNQNIVFKEYRLIYLWCDLGKSQLLSRWNVFWKFEK